jgi:hypothetical protein
MSTFGGVHNRTIASIAQRIEKTKLEQLLMMSSLGRPCSYLAPMYCIKKLPLRLFTISGGSMFLSSALLLRRHCFFSPGRDHRQMKSLRRFLSSQQVSSK